MVCIPCVPGVYILPKTTIFSETLDNIFRILTEYLLNTYLILSGIYLNFLIFSETLGSPIGKNICPCKYGIVFIEKFNLGLFLAIFDIWAILPIRTKRPNFVQKVKKIILQKRFKLLIYDQKEVVMELWALYIIQYIQIAKPQIAKPQI